MVSLVVVSAIAMLILSLPQAFKELYWSLAKLCKNTSNDLSNTTAVALTNTTISQNKMAITPPIAEANESTRNAALCQKDNGKIDSIQINNIHVDNSQSDHDKSDNGKNDTIQIYNSKNDNGKNIISRDILKPQAPPYKKSLK